MLTSQREKDTKNALGLTEVYYPTVKCPTDSTLPHIKYKLVHRYRLRNYLSGDPPQHLARVRVQGQQAVSSRAGAGDTMPSKGKGRERALLGQRRGHSLPVLGGVVGARARRRR